MAVNKVVYGDTTLIDLTEDTVSSESLLTNKVAYGASGTVIDQADPVACYQMSNRSAQLRISNNAIGRVEGTTLVLLEETVSSGEEEEDFLDIYANENNEDNEDDEESPEFLDLDEIISDEEVMNNGSN